MDEAMRRKQQKEEEKEGEGVRPGTPDSDDSDDSFHTTSGDDPLTDPMADPLADPLIDSMARLAKKEEEEEEEEEEDSPCYTPDPEKDKEEEEDEEEKKDPTKNEEEEEEEEKKDATKKEEEEEEEEDEECFVDVEYLKDLELSITEEERTARREESLQHKESGNVSFREGNLQPAVASYTAGLRVCPLSFSRDRAVLYANRAAARAKMDQKKQAIKDCTQALELDEGYTKATLRRATLNQETDQLDDALRDFQRVLELDPSNQQAQEAVRRLPDMITERNEKLKEEMMGKLKDLGNMFLRPFGLSTSNFEMKQDSGSGGYNISFKQNPENNNH